MKKFRRWDVFFLALLIVYPMVPGIENALNEHLHVTIGPHIPSILIFALLALALNVVVGYSGLLQLGIAAFFGIGAYTAGIFTVEKFPFQIGFWFAVPLGVVLAAAAGAFLGSPTLRLRGDYLAIVTLGFGEVVRVSLINLFNITDGPQGLNPIPPPALPEWFMNALSWVGVTPDFSTDYRMFYYLFLAIVVVVVLLLRNLERSRLRRAGMAVRGDSRWIRKGISGSRNVSSARLESSIPRR